MNTFVNNIADATTDNGALTFSTSNKDVVDLFFVLGSIRDKAKITQGIRDKFKSAMFSSPSLTLRLLLWTRDIREGAGGRAIFKELLKDLYSFYPVGVKNLIPHLYKVGRWDDMFCLLDLFSKEQISSMMKEEGNIIRTILDVYETNITKGCMSKDNKFQLLCKWTPRKGTIFNILFTHLGETPKEFRKFLVKNSETVENLMCKKEWSNINYNHVPSQASLRLKGAFSRNDGARYSEWLSSLSKDANSKVNIRGITPIEVMSSARKSGKYDNPLEETQWETMLKEMNIKGNIIPFVDVSGSMTCGYCYNSVTYKDAAISLGVFLSESIQGVFKRTFLVFSDTAKIGIIPETSNLQNKYSAIYNSTHHMGTTSLESGFKAILDHAKFFNVSQEEMPNTIVIFSDMEFNVAIRDGMQVTNYNLMKKLYEDAGYEIPKVVFWNLAGKLNNVPVKSSQNDTALVSGFTQNLMKGLFEGDIDNPEAVVLKTLNTERYLSIVPNF